ncbi:Glucose-6-phosphate exchanger SLC37A4 [Araneus ventricosus]|uniref:Glucose-6-phosphate exchanger SLC37A4 n=1 Tax=Araneus ventricosus TaxID=182803 RepID=A0A4Y2HUZ8_ARAVE|nr:Glucose-6-phosphate exchanger SLC37A4 [Araneus ventricosus]
MYQSKSRHIFSPTKASFISNSNHCILVSRRECLHQQRGEWRFLWPDSSRISDGLPHQKTGREARSSKMARSRTRLMVAMVFMLMSAVTLYALHSTVKESSSLVWILTLGFVLGSCLYGPITIFGIVSTESAPSHLSGSSNAIAALAGNVGAMISGFPFCYVAKMSGWSTVFLILEVATSAVLFVMMASWFRHSKTSTKSKED